MKVLVYAYCVGVPSSRRIEKRLREDIAFRVLAANNTPEFPTVSDFRKDHLVALGGLFLKALELYQQAGLVKLGHVSLDGTKMKANASKHKAQALPLVQQIKANTGSLPKEASADAGYYSAQAVEELYALGGGPLHPARQDPAWSGSAAGAPRSHGFSQMNGDGQSAALRLISLIMAS